MNHIALQDEPVKEKLFPFTLTRSAADIRTGILTIREKWERIFQKKPLYPQAGDGEQKLAINANIIPSEKYAGLLFSDKNNSGSIPYESVRVLEHPWHIFEFNDWAIREDFTLITSGRTSQPVSSSNKLIAPENIFLEEGAQIEHCILNASAGPVYIGKDALVMEGAMIRGPVAICESAVVKMGTAIYGATTIGPNCTVGGEIKNTVLFGNSNKAHHGYLGDSVIGEWCNLGAGTSNSNMKNTAREVKVWSMARKQFDIAGIKCGLLMGDYSRSAINTSFNTGTVVGVCANIFGSGDLTPKYIPNFSWGLEAKYKFEKAIEEITAWMKMKNKLPSEEQVKTLHHIFEHY
jgi:UDP-N-acetylglucosamine diphosphorylase / glucose-1-phosphate thymidylyltransferase / UDP-N-acetylgalactosamine diphosphorylase / glucosamine-1-phosphate N-acetyltransferase / galactosamine-1-phosphate N-acetyltransferase